MVESSQNFTVSKKAIMKAKMNQGANGAQRAGKKQKKKESAYHHVSVAKLMDAFE